VNQTYNIIKKSNSQLLLLGKPITALKAQQLENWRLLGQIIQHLGKFRHLHSHFSKLESFG